MPAFVKHIGSNIGTSAIRNITVPAGGVAAGNLLVLRHRSASTGIAPSVTDSRGNTYTSRIVDYGQSQSYLYVLECHVTTALLANDTISWSQTSAAGQLAVDEFSGVGAYQDQLAAYSGTGPPSVGPFSGYSANGLLLAVHVYWNTQSLSAEDSDTLGGAAWSTLTDTGLNFAAYKLPASVEAQTYAPTMSDMTSQWTAAILSWSPDVQYVYARPIADVATTGWSTAPLYSKVDDDPDAPDGTVVSASV